MDDKARREAVRRLQALRLFKWETIQVMVDNASAVIAALTTKE